MRGDPGSKSRKGTAAKRPSRSAFQGEERPGSGRLPVTTLSSFKTGALFAMQDNGWDHALEVTADGKGLVGRAGGILLRKLADGCGLTAALDGRWR